MILVLLAHLGAAVLAAVAAPWLGRRAFWLAALGPASGLVLAAAIAGPVIDGDPWTSSTEWVPQIGLGLDFRIDAFALMMLTLVGGIGVLVMLYSAQYFSGNESGLGRFAALLTLFAGAMTGLVTADGLLLIFVFWELTSVTSYGLIGFKDTDPAARSAATQALLITGVGGLALLAGLLGLSSATGAGALSELAGTEPAGALVNASAVLVLIGCFTKSAQVPFHGWLPGAMAAPTPVSSYLHSATMVKAGVFLIARLSPSLHELVVWRPLTVGVGLATMGWGGYRALRQHDLKLILAYGTVSQLGMLVAVFGGGETKLLFAGTALLFAHALFKASLFMTVGIIDHSTHTRDIRELSGLGRQLPGLALIAVIGGASMAGMIPLLGFVAKEAAIVGFLNGHFGLVDLALAGFVIGSGLTTAYTLRLLWGGFGTSEGVEVDLHRPGWALVAPPAVLAVPTVVLGIMAGWADAFLRPAGMALDSHVEKYHLVLWPGLGLGLGLSVVAVASGVVLFSQRDRIEALQARLARRRDAADIFAAGFQATLRGSARLTGVVQNGSLPTYLGIITVGSVALPTVALLTDLRLPDEAIVADSPVQFAVIVAMMAAAAAVTVAKRRFGAVLMLGAVGFGGSTIYVLHGAPDLALTQALVETVSITIYVLVLRHLPERFESSSWTLARLVRLGVAGLVGLLMFGLMATTMAERTAPPIDGELAARSYPEADGKNVVNVILVDFRGFDTLGEGVVLAVAALGVVSLVRAGRRRDEIDDALLPGPARANETVDDQEHARHA